MSETNESSCAKPGHFSWNELITTDPKASATFYGSLFGWQATPFTPKGAPAGGPPYTLFKTDANDMGAGGMMQAPQPGIPSHWLPYVVVENVDASLAKASGLGAKTLLPVMSIGEVGRIAVIQDPQGAVIGLHEPSM
ncbi:MAG TPA: VOC family protein [Verrucomicrobiae bacterium]